MATDKGGIQFRVLNSRKGPAVRATRAQADRVLYKAAVREILENQPNLWIFQQAADDLIVEQDQVRGVVTQMGLRFFADSVVLRSEEHTSELQSLMRISYAVFCLKKKK